VPRDAVGQPLDLARRVGQQGQAHVGVGHLAAGTQLPDLDGIRGRAQRRGHRVREVEHRLRVAEAGEQAVHVGRHAIGDGEVGAEPHQVAGARAAPAVDRLVGVANRRDRRPVRADGVAGAGAEQRPQQHPLCVPGVLVLVEQHRPEGGPLGDADLGMGVGDPGRDRELVGEVDGALGPLARRERLHQRQQDGALALHVDPALVLLRRFGPLPLRPRRVRQLVDHAVGVAADRVRVDEVLAQLSGQRQQPLGDRRRHDVEIQVVAPARHHPVRELPRRRLRQQPGGRLRGQPQRVLAHQPARVRVVGGDGGLAGHQLGPAGARRVQVVEQPGAGQPPQPRPHPRAELLRGLAGERQPQHLLGPHGTRRDQPDDPRRHRLGLARPRPRDDQRRTSGRGDHRGLLVGRRRQAQRMGQHVGGERHRPVLHR
jgi:hypothetical protein